jgi:AcrR family transcriptional regulator
MREKKISRRQREALMHRQLILDTAVKLFSERGYENVSMQEIANEAEFAVGTIYKFFENKENLYRSILITKAQEVHHQFDEVLSRQGDALDLIREFVEVFAQIVEDNRDIVRLYFSESRGIRFQTRKEFESEMQEMEKRTAAKLNALMQRAIDAGQVKDLSPDYLSITLGGMLDGFFIKWVDDPERYPMRDVVPFILNCFLTGVVQR